MHRSHFKTQHFTRRASRSGFTLVEIAVALAIFVVGALAIIQIFPPALNVVRGSERRTTAAQLSRSRVSYYENILHIAPDAIYATVGGAWSDVKSTITNAALMQTGGINSATIPRGPTDDITQTTLGQFKHVRGEKQQVKSGSIGGTNVSYVLTQFPYTGNVSVYTEDTLTGVTVNSTGYLDFSQAKTSTGSSFSDGSLPASTPTLNTPLDSMRDNSATTAVECEYYVTYRWAGAGGRIEGVVDEPLLIPDDAHASWTAAPTSNNRVLRTSGVIPGSVTVRVRKLAGTVVPGAALPASPVTENLVGLVRLDGLALSSTTVSLDYDVSDWRTIVVDETPSRPLNTTSAGQWNVLAPMQNLNPETPIVAFFERPNPAPTASAPVLGGATWTDGTAPPAVGPRILEANPSAGRITYDIPPVDAGDPTPSTPTRTVLNTSAASVSTLDNWAHQLTVAAASYVPYLSGQTGTAINGYLQHPRQGWREYVWSGSTLYFQASEAGKLVMVDYEYSLSGGGYQTVHGAIFPISVQDAPVTAPAGFAPTSGQAATVTLTTLSGQAAAPVTAITAVRGVSIAARTAWLENGRYTQVVTKGYRPLIPVL